MGKSGPLERAQLANQIQGFRIPARSDARENNKDLLVTLVPVMFLSVHLCVHAKVTWKCMLTKMAGGVFFACKKIF